MDRTELYIGLMEEKRQAHIEQQALCRRYKLAKQLAKELHGSLSNKQEFKQFYYEVNKDGIIIAILHNDCFLVKRPLSDKIELYTSRDDVIWNLKISLDC